MSKIFISCDEATTVCDKNQYGEARFSDKIKLTLHLLLCKVCKCYSQQNSIMSKVFGHYSDNKCTKEKCLCNGDKEKMENNLKEKMEV